jgi:hypothetical protein
MLSNSKTTNEHPIAKALEVLKDDILQAITTGNAATPQQKVLTEARPTIAQSQSL